MKKVKKLFLFSLLAAAAGSIYYYMKNGRLPFSKTDSYEPDDEEFEEELNDLFDDFDEAEEIRAEEELASAVEDALSEMKDAWE